MVLQPLSFLCPARIISSVASDGGTVDYKLGVKLFLPLIDFQSDLLTDSHNS